MKIVLSGIKPTGIPTLGNYLGALKYFVKLQNEMKDYEFFLFIADLHALTTKQDPQTLKENIRKLAALYMACGLNEDNLTLFIQSEVKAHVELGYLLEGVSYFGELSRMTQFKDKTKKGEEGISGALFTYPALMAADILLYDAEFVPVGKDQTQHLELTKTLAERFNARYGKTFAIPKLLKQEKGEKILDLQDPNHKMDKSRGDDKGCILLLDDLQSVKKKIKAAVTDSGREIKYDPENKPGLSNLIVIYALLTNSKTEDVTNKYKGKGYGEFKNDLANLVACELEKIQTSFKHWYSSPKLDILLDNGRKKAESISAKKMEEVKRKMGYGR